MNSNGYANQKPHKARSPGWSFDKPDMTSSEDVAEITREANPPDRDEAQPATKDAQQINTSRRSTVFRTLAEMSSQNKHPRTISRKPIVEVDKSPTFSKPIQDISPNNVQPANLARSFSSGHLEEQVRKQPSKGVRQKNVESTSSPDPLEIDQPLIPDDHAMFQSDRIAMSRARGLLKTLGIKTFAIRNISYERVQWNEPLLLLGVDKDGRALTLLKGEQEMREILKIPKIIQVDHSHPEGGFKIRIRTSAEGKSPNLIDIECLGEKDVAKLLQLLQLHGYARAIKWTQCSPYGPSSS